MMGDESRTLSLDIGGSGIKGMVLNENGDPVSQRMLADLASNLL